MPTPREPKGRPPRPVLVSALRALAAIPRGPRLLRFHRPTQHFHITAPDDQEHIFTPQQAAAYLQGAYDAIHAISAEATSHHRRPTQLTRQLTQATAELGEARDMLNPNQEEGTAVNPQDVIERVVAGTLPGRQYPQPLHDDLAPWYCYLADGGHSILAALNTGHDDLETGRLVPVPVKSILRAGWTTHDGYVHTDLPYDPEAGPLMQPGDEEF